MRIALRRSARGDPAMKRPAVRRNALAMRFSLERRPFALVVAVVACGLAACSGNLGSGGVGGGLPVAPGAQGYQQPQGPGAASTSRERVVEGAVFETPATATIPLPAAEGFGLVLDLTPPASASPAAAPSGSPSAPARALRERASRVVQIAQTLTSTATPSAAPSGSPQAASSPAPSGSVPPASPTPAGKASAHPSPHPSPSGPRIDTKIVIYPNYAPEAPTPEPTGNVQTFTHRRPIVRGYLSSAVDIPLYGLAAVRFTIPAAEQLPNRGYTIAIFTSIKHKKPGLVASDTAATLANNVVSSPLTTPLTLKRGTGYDIVLYGDELPSTPAPVPSGYATPGNNPFVTPLPSGYPQASGPPGMPNGTVTAVPLGATPTPYGGH